MNIESKIAPDKLCDLFGQFVKEQEEKTGHKPTMFECFLHGVAVESNSEMFVEPVETCVGCAYFAQSIFCCMREENEGIRVFPETEACDYKT